MLAELSHPPSVQEHLKQRNPSTPLVKIISHLSGEKGANITTMVPGWKPKNSRGCTAHSGEGGEAEGKEERDREREKEGEAGAL